MVKWGNGWVWAGVSAGKKRNKQDRWEFGTQSAAHVHESNCKYVLLPKGDDLVIPFLLLRSETKLDDVIYIPLGGELTKTVALFAKFSALQRGSSLQNRDSNHINDPGMGPNTE